MKPSLAVAVSSYKWVTTPSHCRTPVTQEARSINLATAIGYLRQSNFNGILRIWRKIFSIQREDFKLTSPTLSYVTSQIGNRSPSLISSEPQHSSREPNLDITYLPAGGEQVPSSVHWRLRSQRKLLDIWVSIPR